MKRVYKKFLGTRYSVLGLHATEDPAPSIEDHMIEK